MLVVNARYTANAETACHLYLPRVETVARSSNQVALLILSDSECPPIHRLPIEPSLANLLRIALQCSDITELVNVVDEYIGGGGGDVEVVVAGDGEVPHPAGPVPGGVAAEGGGGAACGGAQAGAVLQGGGLDPAVGGGVPERVVAGGVDDRGAA